MRHRTTRRMQMRLTGMFAALGMVAVSKVSGLGWVRFTRTSRMSPRVLTVTRNSGQIELNASWLVPKLSLSSSASGARVIDILPVCLR